jgi:hypothetical protein
MSAFVVSKKHIDRLVATIYRGPAGRRSYNWSLIDYAKGELHDNPGQALIDENLKSIHARYPDTIDKPENTPGPIARYWEAPYAYTVRDCDRLPVVDALKALACFEYQACEHSDWQTSDVHDFCERFRHFLIARLDGYEDAKWKIV